MALVFGSVMGLVGLAHGQDPARLDQLTQQWLETERQATHLQSDWRNQQPVLVQRIALLKAERQQLQAMLQDNKADLGDVDKRRATLLSEQAALEQQQQEVARAVELLRHQLTVISALLPPPLLQAWDDELANLDGTAETSRQLQVALAQLSHVADFDNRISVQQTPIKTPDGQQVQVKQLFMGVGMAWFTSSDGQYAGWGQARDDGWHWQFDDAIDSAEISSAIAMFEKHQQADFVRLPVKLTEGADHE